MNYLKYLVEEIHTTVVATVDDAGLPVLSDRKRKRLL